MRGGTEDNSKTIFLFLYKNLCCDLSTERSVEMVLMMGHNICFKGVLWIIIPQLSLLFLLKWRTGSL